MQEKFKAVVIDNQNEKFSREIKEIDTSHLKDGNVLVKIDYSSLNYKDALILNNGGKIVRKFPFVPGIDFSGKVVESESALYMLKEWHLEILDQDRLCRICPILQQAPSITKWVQLAHPCQEH